MPKARIAIVLPNSMVIRNTLETPVVTELAVRDDLEAVLLTPYEDNARALAALGAPHLTWAPMANPVAGAGLSYGGPAAALARVAQRLTARALRPWVGFGQLVYRFNHLQGFAGHRQKRALPPEDRTREALAGNYVDERLGRPCPGSRALFKLLYRLYYARWYSEPTVEAFFDRFQPDLLVLHHLQYESIRPYANAARRRGVPILGIVGSWDQPTTKGPLCAGVDRFLVQSRRMRQELERFHGVPEDRVEVTGWPQMDVYFKTDAFLPREQFLAQLGVPAGNRIILFGANSQRLGRHEPSVVEFLAGCIQEGGWPVPCTLIVRPHPKDRQWRERLGRLHSPPAVLVLPAEMGRLDVLANLLRHAAVLVSTGGTISLDALALDTCVVNIGFDGDLRVRPEHSVRRWFELEHYEAVVQSGGVRLVEDFDHLQRAVLDYIMDPSLDAGGREQCRRDQLEPLDGMASRRLVSFIARWAHAAAA